MGQLYPYSTKWEKNVVVVLHIYGARPLFYSFLITKILNLNNEKKKR